MPLKHLPGRKYQYDPNWRRTYWIDFTNELNPGATIASHVVTPQTGIQVENDSIVTNVTTDMGHVVAQGVTFRPHSALVGDQVVNVKITATDGDVMDVDITFEVAER